LNGISSLKIVHDNDFAEILCVMGFSPFFRFCAYEMTLVPSVTALDHHATPLQTFLQVMMHFEVTES